jgi:hypothetical protein
MVSLWPGWIVQFAHISFLGALINLSPETVIVSGDKSTLIMRPVFGEYYTEMMIYL